MKTHTITIVLISAQLLTIILSGQNVEASNYHSHEDSPLFKASLERSVEKMALRDKAYTAQNKERKVLHHIAVVDHNKQRAYVLSTENQDGMVRSVTAPTQPLSNGVITPQFDTISSCYTVFSCPTTDYSCYVTTCADTISCGATCGTTCISATCSGATCEPTSCTDTISCGYTCSVDTISCGATCDTTCSSTCIGATCEVTCFGTCESTCNDPTCGATCTGPTCGATCDGATCDVASCLEITEIVLETNQCVSICAASSPGTVCVLECSTNLESAVWDYVTQEACSGTDVWLQHTQTVENVLFYRVTVHSYLEDFDDGLAQDWVEEVEENWQVVAGEYRAQSSSGGNMASSYEGQIWTNVTVQVSCRRDGANNTAAGLILRQTQHDPDTVSAYLFRIAESGSFNVVKYVENSYTELQGWLESSAIQTGTNILMATASGSSLQFFINGTLVWSGTDTSLNSGHIGLIGYTDDTYTSTHYFDNVTAGDPVLY